MLTNHQEEKRDELTRLLYENFFVVLEGSAGVGKTYMVNEFIRQLPRELKRGKVVCAAPTHKALAVLMSKVETTKETPIKFATLDSLLSYRAVTNPKTGVREFVSKPHPKYPPLKGVALLIIDEASMIGIDKYLDVCMYAEEQGTKVLFIGDEKQINPVKEVESPVFLGYPTEMEKVGKSINWTSSVVEYENFSIEFSSLPVVSLTEIIRQGEGNPIIDFSRNLDKCKQQDIFECKTDPELSGVLTTRNYSKIIEELALENGTDNVKFISWTNKEVDQVNKDVRRVLYGEPKKVELYESIIFNSPYGETYKTNQEVTINSLKIIDKTYYVTFADNSNIVEDKKEEVKLKVYLINENDKEPVVVVHEDSEKDFKNLIRTLKANAREKLLKFTTLNSFLDRFADFKYNHAITVHKSQGSTFKKAIVSYNNIMMNKNDKERVRLLYTAITRASDLLILYKK